MDPISILAAISASIDIAEKLLPLVSQLKADGQITADQQADILARFESLKAKADGQFSGPEWQVDPK